MTSTRCSAREFPQCHITRSMSKRGRKSKRRMSRAPLRHRQDQAPEGAAMSDLESNNDDEEGSPRLRDDFWSILILLFLYILQGIPIGLTASVPMILQARKVSYGNQVKERIRGQGGRSIVYTCDNAKFESYIRAITPNSKL